LSPGSPSADPGAAHGAAVPDQACTYSHVTSDTFGKIFGLSFLFPQVLRYNAVIGGLRS
jgi:hypothetical protein